MAYAKKKKKKSSSRPARTALSVARTKSARPTGRAGSTLRMNKPIKGGR